MPHRTAKGEVRRTQLRPPSTAPTRRNTVRRVSQTARLRGRRPSSQHVAIQAKDPSSRAGSHQSPASSSTGQPSGSGRGPTPEAIHRRRQGVVGVDEPPPVAQGQGQQRDRPPDQPEEEGDGVEAQEVRPGPGHPEGGRQRSHADDLAGHAHGCGAPRRRATAPPRSRRPQRGDGRPAHRLGTPGPEPDDRDARPGRPRRRRGRLPARRRRSARRCCGRGGAEGTIRW